MAPPPVDPSALLPCLDASRSTCPGHDPRRCRAHKSNGEPCQKFPRHGAEVCDTHGGSTPQVKAAASVRVTEGKLREKVGRLKVEPVTHPMRDLQMLAGKAKAWMEVCEEHIAELEKLRYSTEGGEQIRGEVVLFERALEACRKVLVDQVRLGIDDRLSLAAKLEGQMYAAVMARFARHLGHDPADPRVQRAAVLAISEETGVGPAIIEGKAS